MTPRSSDAPADPDRRRRFEDAALPLADGLFRAARALAGSDADAEDLVQETYLHAWRGFSSYSRDDNFKAWMYVILRHAWLDRCRRRRVEPSLPLDAEPVAPAPATAIDLERLLPDELHRALESLPPTHRLMVLLCDVESFSYREIAGILGCPIGTVMSGLHNARRRMRQSLASRPAATTGGPAPRPEAAS